MSRFSRSSLMKAAASFETAHSLPLLLYLAWSASEPFVQGDAVNLLAHHTKFGSHFMEFGYGRDSTTNELFITIPRPEKLAEILAALGLDYVELVSGGTPISVDEYFRLLSTKKIPLAKIATHDDCEDESMLYHAYFHDLFNHVFLWVALPDHLKTVVAKRAALFIETFASLESAFFSDPDALEFIKFLKFIAAAEFDSHMGTSNNDLLGHPDPFSVDKDHKDEIESRYQMFMNFGFVPNKNPSVIFKPHAFVATWFMHLSNFFENEFRELSEKIKAKEQFVAFDIIQKDQIARSAFEHLEKLPLEMTKRAIRQVRDKACMLFEVDQKAPLADTKFPSIEELYQQITERYQSILDTLNNSQRLTQ